MYQPSAPHSGRTALICGLSGGIGMGIVQSLMIVVLHYTADSSLNYLSVIAVPVSILLWIALFMLAGVFAAKQTGKVSTGTLAGLWAGIVGGLITSSAIFFSTMSNIDGFSIYGPDFTSIIALTLTSLIFFTLVMLGAGTGLGSLGGLIGQSFSPFKSQAPAMYQPTFIPNQPPFMEQTRRDPEPPIMGYRQRDPEPPSSAQ